MFTITCLVNDETQPGSGLRAEHGLSFLVETEEEDILFDTGASGQALLHNASILSVELRRVTALVISHSHPDHTGGMRAFLSLVPGCKVFSHPAIFQERFARRRRWRSKYIGLPLSQRERVFAHPGIFQERFARRRRWRPKYVGLPLSQREIEEHAELDLSSQPVEVAPRVWTTGEVVPRPGAEGRSARHVIHTPRGWAPDPYADDLALVLETPQGLVVVLGCGHSGLLNTLALVCHIFDGQIQAVLGGAHLLDLGKEEIDRIVSILREEYGSPWLYLNHCTGDRALSLLSQAFPDRTVPCPAGTLMEF